MECRQIEMAGLGQILSRTLFWSYERGTWQYDLAVILILVFVLLTPHGWFHDQPQVGMPAAAGQVQLLSTNGESETYQIDTRVLGPHEQTPQLENELHNALQKSISELHHGRFAIAKIDPVRDAQGGVIAYRVEIHH